MPKTHRKKAIRSIRGGFTPTPERKNQAGGVQKEVVDRDFHNRILVERYKAAYECLLDYYMDIEKISEPEYRVGIEFRRAYLRAVIGIQVLDKGSGSHGSPDMKGIMLYHSEKIVKQTYEVLSAPQKAVVIGVCGHDERPKNSYNFETFQRGLCAMVEQEETRRDTGYK